MNGLRGEDKERERTWHSFCDVNVDGVVYCFYLEYDNSADGLALNF